MNGFGGVDRFEMANGIEIAGGIHNELLKWCSFEIHVRTFKAFIVIKELVNTLAVSSPLLLE